MLNLPSDMIALAQEIPPPKEWILACLKMPVGDVWLSDRPVFPALVSLLPAGASPLPIVEDWGTLDNGISIDKIIAAGESGYLCAPKTRIVLIRADQTKSIVDSIISQGIHNKRIELYQWFVGMTSAPVLIDTLFCQDRIELSESSMLFSFDAVGALASEDPYMTDRANGQKNWPYLIGKAEGMRLEMLEDASSKWTVLLGDQGGNEVSEDYIGLIRVEDATQLNPGQHLINGEEVILAKVSAAYMEITARARGGTEAQVHDRGSRIFPLNAVFKYAACAGPIGSFSKLRTSNEVDFYDEDGDGDTTEYRDLYSGGNEAYHPEMNPAQIWFNDRMPWLKKDQDYSITDKVFYGKLHGTGDVSTSWFASGINVEDGKPRIDIPFRKFASPIATSDYRTQESQMLLPGISGDGPTYNASENISEGKFAISQHHGDPLAVNHEDQPYREFRMNDTVTVNEEGFTMIAPNYPTDLSEYVRYRRVWLSLAFVYAETSYMRARIQVLWVRSSGIESNYLGLQRDFGSVAVGPQGIGSMTGEVIGTWQNFPLYGPNDRLKMKLTCLGEGTGSPRYAFVRIGGFSLEADGVTVKNVFYGGGMFWQYSKAEPENYISSSFGRDLSSKGVFESAKIKISGKIHNTGDKAIGTLQILENDVELSATSITDGDYFDYELTLNADSWIALSNTEVKVLVHLDDIDGDLNGSAGVEIDGGMQWLITYTSNTLDGVQVRYAGQLYVDAISSRGANWTPAKAFKWLSEDKTSWAVDMLDPTEIDARHAEYVAAGHYLNGLISQDRYQGAIKEIARQGFFFPIHSNGKVSLQSYLSWPSLVMMTGDNDSLLEKSKTFSMTDTISVIQRMTFDYNKNFSTGIFDGQYELSTGGHVEHLSTISFDMVRSSSAISLMASWLFNLKSIQLKCFGFDVNFRLIQLQAWDKIELPSFIDNDSLNEFIVLGVKLNFPQPKNNKHAKTEIETIKV